MCLVSEATGQAAQDFHDFTSQVVAEVVPLTHDLEDRLVELLVSVVLREKVDPKVLARPVVNPEDPTDAVKNDGDIDDPLTSPAL